MQTTIQRGLERQALKREQLQVAGHRHIPANEAAALGFPNWLHFRESVVRMWDTSEAMVLLIFRWAV